MAIFSELSSFSSSSSSRSSSSSSSSQPASPSNLHTSKPTVPADKPTFSEDDIIELELLRDEEIDSLVYRNLIPRKDQWNPTLRSLIVFPHKEVTLEVTTGHPYPATPLAIWTVTNHTLSKITCDRLRSLLREAVKEDEKTTSLEKWQQRKDHYFESQMSVVKIATEASFFLAEYRANLAAERLQSLKLSPPNSAPRDIYSRGIDVSMVSGNGAVFDLLGQTPEQICQGIPENFRILHIESVVQGDLCVDFLTRKKELRKELLERQLSDLRRSTPLKFRSKIRGRSGEKEMLVDGLLMPRLTFHGTRRDLVPSIIRHGFLLPGDRIPHSTTNTSIRCGSTYGPGIYSSPLAAFALSYSGGGAYATAKGEYDGLKLIVCATMMGISAALSRDDNWRNHKEAWAGSNSHVSTNQMEYIVFHRAQIIPCYVIHLDWGIHNDVFFDSIPQNSNQWINTTKSPRPDECLTQLSLVKNLAPGDRQRAKEALQSRAEKWFSYGYGPATGTSFVIEAVGEVDEDDEDYGTYQQDRIDEANTDGQTWGEESGGDVWRWQNIIPEDGQNEKDEYFEARRARSKRVEGVREG